MRRAEVLRAWQKWDTLVSLPDGGVAALPDGWLEKYGDRLADLLAAQTPDGRLPMSAMPDLAKLCEELDHPPPPSFERLRPLLEEFDGIPKAVHPPDFDGTLRNYQEIGVDWLARCGRRTSEQLPCARDAGNATLHICQAPDCSDAGCVTRRICFAPAL